MRDVAARLGVNQGTVTNWIDRAADQGPAARFNGRCASPSARRGGRLAESAWRPHRSSPRHRPRGRKPSERTIAEVARALGVKPDVVYHWTKRGHVPWRRGRGGRRYIDFTPEVAALCRRRIAASVHLQPRQVPSPAPLTGAAYEATVPTVADRIVQAAVRSCSSRSSRPTCLDCSFGFRPRRVAARCPAGCSSMRPGRSAVGGGDGHRQLLGDPAWRLMPAVEERICDRGLLDAAARDLRAGVMEDGAPRRAPGLRGRGRLPCYATSTAPAGPGVAWRGWDAGALRRRSLGACGSRGRPRRAGAASGAAADLGLQPKARPRRGSCT